FTGDFSYSGSVCLAELLKLAISAVLFFCEWLLRRDEFHYQIIGGDVDGGLSEKGMTATATRRPWGQFPRALLEEVRLSSVSGFAQLAMLYTAINNDVFILLRIADPGTVQLFNSGLVLFPAIVMTIVPGIGFGGMQWVAIMIQVFGLIISQFSPEPSSIYPATTYLFVVVYTCVSAFTAVYHEALSQSSNASLHADNMVLFSVGSLTNFTIHIIFSWWSPGGPGLFDGYTDPDAIVLLLSSVFIGLATTAVYRLFLAVWIYYKGPKDEDPSFVPEVSDAPTPPLGSSCGDVCNGLLSGRSAEGIGYLGWISMLAKAAVTIAIIVAGTKVIAWEPSDRLSQMTRAPSSSPPTPRVRTSPLSNVLAFVRWNSDEHLDRKAMLEAYRPFFYNMHYSIPGSTSSSNLVSDGSGDSHLIYKQVARTMQLLLDEQPDVMGLLYYQSDSWVDPLRFNSIDLDKIWFPDSIQPRFACMEGKDIIPEIFLSDEDARRARNAVKALSASSDGVTMNGSKINPNEICSG
ncbi:hypothetical protein GP486_007979, partial [Trichoglossum hirsutum]